MAKKKKIALLNLRFDNNYGGNLQRYALVTVLQRMGHSVEYLYIRDNWDDWFTNRSVITIIKQSLKQLLRHIRHPKSEPWLAWHREHMGYIEECKDSEAFLDKYVPHTSVICSHKKLERVFKKGHYDAVVAGSDQIWRKKFVERYGIGTWFLDFVPFDFSGERVIYGASFGVDKEEYNVQDTDLIRPLFERLSSVSVREKTGLYLLAKYMWEKPSAEVVLDPTLLLTKTDYEILIENSEAHAIDGDMLCYILDMNQDIEDKINSIAKKRGLKPYILGLERSKHDSIEDWLRNIRNAKFVFTDSYHGLLFSIIFKKPFYLVYNEFRGNARFDSVLELLEISLDNPDYAKIEDRLAYYRNISLAYLRKAL